LTKQNFKIYDDLPPYYNKLNNAHLVTTQALVTQNSNIIQKKHRH